MAKRNGRTSTPQTKEWTVMVYMASENDAELDAVAVADLKEMERGLEHNPDVNVVVEINRFWPSTAQRYHIDHRGTRLFPSPSHTPTNMARLKTLDGFLQWVANNKSFQARRYALVLWGHAYGLGYGRDHGDKLTLKEISEALRLFNDKRGQKLEILGANACAMSYVEAAFELRNRAEYMVASQISVPFAGWPYKSILSRVGATEPKVLGQLIVNAYVDHYNSLVGGDRVAMSLLNLAAFSNGTSFDALIDSFAKAIAAEIQSGERVAEVRDIFLSAAAGDVRPLIDLADLCSDLESLESANLDTVIKELKKFLPELVRHRTHPTLDDLHGIGIFAPFVTDEEDLKRLELQDESVNGSNDGTRAEMSKAETGRAEYESLELFGPSGSWPRLVYKQLATEISPELLASVTGIPPSTLQDRRSIAQIAVAIDSTFNKLDRIIEQARTCVRKEIHPNPADDPAFAERVLSASQRKQLGPPWLNLIRPLRLDARVGRLRQLRDLKQLEFAGLPDADPTSAEAVFREATRTEPSPQYLERERAAQAANQMLINKVVDFFAKVENAIGDVERATRKGLTHARFGLAPTAPNESGFFEEEPKSGEGFAEEEPKSGEGLEEEPKSGEGPSRDAVTQIVVGGDLRIDRAFARVGELFRQVGRALKRLERANLSVEVTAREMLAEWQAQNLTEAELRLEASAAIERAFRILSDASMDARRTVRRVMAHPMYGLGPGSVSIGLEQRETLANAGGLDRRNLRLL